MSNLKVYKVRHTGKIRSTLVVATSLERAAHTFKLLAPDKRVAKAIDQISSYDEAVYLDNR